MELERRIHGRGHHHRQRKVSDRSPQDHPVSRVRVLQKIDQRRKRLDSVAGSKSTRNELHPRIDLQRKNVSGSKTIPEVSGDFSDAGIDNFERSN